MKLNGLPSDLLSIVWHNLRQRPLLDRIFYVPFWDCPYMCEFCCVDSLPGKPPADPVAGERALFEMMDALSAHTGEQVQVHIYGGEPLLRPDTLARLSEKVAARASFKKLYVYSTLKRSGIERVVEAVGDATKLRVVVNDFTADERVHARMSALGGIAEFYANAITFPTGRGQEGSEAYTRNEMERFLPAWAPGRSCFANASGPLINGAHGTIHLCCLPQSPVVGHIDEDAHLVLQRHIATLKTFHADVLKRMRAQKISHACKVCQACGTWDTRHAPSTSHLRPDDPSPVRL